MKDDLVGTILGDVPERDLRMVTEQVAENDTSWTVARECRYIGNKFPDRRDEIVRRDVWVTFKRGQTAEAQSQLR